MNHTIQATIESWDTLTHRVLALEEIPLCQVQALLKDSYALLTRYCQEDLVPKEMAKLLLTMDEYLFFAELMEEKEKGKGYYRWEESFFAVKALKEGFFKGRYPQDYPLLQITDCLDCSCLFDLEKDSMEQYVLLFQQRKAETI